VPYQISTLDLPCAGSSARNTVNGTTRLKLFTSEPEALRWLDERAREEAAGKKAAP